MSYKGYYKYMMRLIHYIQSYCDFKLSILPLNYH